jgi:hypothetical protein
MLKSTFKEIGGTSFHNSTVTATVNELIFVIDKPNYNGNDGEDKVNFEWELEDEEGNVVTIYDWKEYRKIGYDEQIEWHIGGMSKEITDNAKEDIEFTLNYKNSSAFI